MNSPSRIRTRWPGWLAWALPAGVSLIVIGYLVFLRAARAPAPFPGLFWGELLIFGAAGPAVAWLLLRQLVLDAATGRDAAERIAELMTEERHHTQKLTALLAVSTAMAQALNEEEALGGALSRVHDVLDLASSGVYLLDGQTGQPVLVAARGARALLDPDAAALIAAEGPHGAPALTGRPPQAGADSIDSRWGRQWCDPADHACAAVPLMATKGALGTLQVAGRRADEFSESDMALLRAVGAQMGVTAENMRFREEARRAEALSTLIQEMHHRIKNNLQTVADLLSLEMSASPSPAARKSLRDSIGRIKSIAAVHELLSLERLRLTDITELARQVCEISLKHLVRPDQRVRAQVDGPVIYLPSKQATALALVMNELIANACEHAFNLNGGEGHLTITTAQDGAQVTVTIADNGRGLAPGFDLAARQGLGLKIVQTLVEKDLAGSLRLQNLSEGGACATLTFFR